MLHELRKSFIRHLIVGLVLLVGFTFIPPLRDYRVIGSFFIISGLLANLTRADLITAHNERTDKSRQKASKALGRYYSFTNIIFGLMLITMVYVTTLDLNLNTLTNQEKIIAIVAVGFLIFMFYQYSMTLKKKIDLEQEQLQ